MTAEPRTLRLAGADGVMLAADAWGDDAAPPLVLLHGGGQTRGAWGAAGERLAGLGWRVLAVDMRGHGDSDWSPDGVYAIDGFAEDVRAVALGLDVPPVLVGASLGGLSSMIAAGEEPRAPVAGLVLVDVAHRPHAEGVARIIEFMSARPEGFASVDEAADAVAAYLPHRTQPEVAAGLERNLRRRGDRWVWHWDPRMLDRFDDRMRLAVGPERLVPAARAIDAPLLLVRGGSSDVITEEIAGEFADLVPGIERVDVAGAGHMVAGDRNDRFLAAMEPFLRRLSPRSSATPPA
jgi:pimeloyl-ACP methyl ester carboxylesterase